MKNVIIAILTLVSLYLIFIQEDTYLGFTAEYWYDQNSRSLQMALDEEYKNNVLESCLTTFLNNEEYRGNLSDFKSYQQLENFCKKISK
jgi:hypothetical protein